MKKNDDQPAAPPSFEDNARSACMSHLDYCRACAPMKDALSYDGHKVVRSTTFDLCPTGKFLAGLTTEKR